MITRSPQTNFESIRSFLNARNFPLVGAVDYDEIKPFYETHAGRYQRWIDHQFHGEMEYLKRGLDRRLDPKKVFPELQSAVVVARPYPSRPVGNEKLRYARYLNGSDYHEAMKADLENAFSQTGLKYKVCVDTSAVLERTWAVFAGLGWIGKNTLLIHPQLGSYLFLGVVFTDQKFGLPLNFQKDYCGNCNRCISACPTQAIISPHDLDARKCVSYLTLEKRGEWEDQVNTAGFLAGCDLCQEVCPYNTKAVKYSVSEDVAPYLLLDEKKLLEETEVEYQERIAGTALSRIKYRDFRRNLQAVIKQS